MWADDENIDEADGTFARIGRLAFGLLVLIAFAGVVWTAFKDAPLNSATCDPLGYTRRAASPDPIAAQTGRAREEFGTAARTVTGRNAAGAATADASKAVVAVDRTGGERPQPVRLAGWQRYG